MKSIRDRARTPKIKARKANLAMTEAEALLADIRAESFAEAETLRDER